jgi:signal transduction histidine kinase/ligand-binding sensor domain-containing protein/DNA-binding response OmpR family regulator
MKSTPSAILFLLVLFFCLPGLRPANAGNLYFYQISLKDGLSQSTVYNIAQDRKGIMWFATADGLNKYNGYTFTIYRNQIDNPHSILSNSIRALLVDSDGILWVGTMDGLCHYDADQDGFVNYPARYKNQKLEIYDIRENNNRQLLLGTNMGLAVFDKRKGTIRLIKEFANSKVNVLFRIRDNVMVGTNKGLYLVSVTDGRTSELDKELASAYIMAIIPDREMKNRYWIGTEGKGLYLYDLEKHSFRHYSHVENDKRSLSSNYVRSLQYDDQNRLWVGTFVGLNILDARTQVFERYFYDPHIEGSVSQNSIRSIFMDAQKGMWLGTFFEGLNYYHPLKNKFVHLNYSPAGNSLSDRVVSAMLVDNSGKIWIGTNDHGLNLHDPSSGRFSYYEHNELDKGSLSGNNVKCIMPADGGNLYIGTHGGGLNLFTRGDNRFRRIHFGATGTADDNVYALQKRKGGSLWIGTLDGLWYYDPQTGQSGNIRSLYPHIFTAGRQIMAMFTDSKGRLWVGSQNGLLIYDMNHNGHTYIMRVGGSERLSTAYISCFFEDSRKIIWIGTNEGLYGFDEQHNRLLAYHAKEGQLSSNVIHGILEDSSNRLWLSTNNGLVCFIPEKGKFRTYYESDGIQSNQFNPYSYCKTGDGQMFFGGINGITAFYPDKITDNPFSPPPIITNLYFFNKRVAPDDKTGILKKDISETKKIELRAGKVMLGVDFVVPNYLSGQRNLFAYKLEGFDTEWYYTSQKLTATYSNLNAGHYVFRVKAANSDGIWNDKTTDLVLEVLPQWWQTFWARSLFILLIGAIIVAVFRFFLSRQKMINELHLQRLQKEQNDELNEMKLRFFVNISHEFRTPLTLIITPIQEMLDRGVKDKWIKEQLLYVQRSSHRLLNLVNQLLDYRRAELGVFDLKVQQGNMAGFCYEVFSLFETLARQKNIDYSFYTDLKDEPVWFDRNYVERILSNLLSNAFKFTPNNCSVSVTLKKSGTQVVLEVVDTGCGMSTEVLKQIFERFYQADENKNGSGIGLALVKRLVELHHGSIEAESAPGKGTKFRLMLPVGGNDYAPQEKSVDEESDHEMQVFSDLSVEPAPVPLSGEKEFTLLIVEDDSSVRKYLAGQLSATYNIFTADNGKEALAVIAGQPVDLIITDVMMPQMNGVQLCRQIKQNIQTCHIPVIMLTAKVNVEDQLEGIQTGADDYLNKPFVLSILLARIRNILVSRKRMLQHYSQHVEVEPEKMTMNKMDEQLLQKALSIVEANLDNCEFSADDFSSEMAMSRSNLHLKLKAITGESTVEFIRKVRLSHACRLLLDGRYSVSEVSTMVGFSTPSYFSSIFKKNIGCLPNDYGKGKHSD